MASREFIETLKAAEEPVVSVTMPFSEWETLCDHAEEAAISATAYAEYVKHATHAATRDAAPVHELRAKNAWALVEEMKKVLYA